MLAGGFEVRPAERRVLANGQPVALGARAFDLLHRLPEPFFLSLPSLEPPEPYQPPGRHRRQFALNRRAP